jgi:hypothetical protein
VEGNGSQVGKIPSSAKFFPGKFFVGGMKGSVGEKNFWEIIFS